MFKVDLKKVALPKLEAILDSLSSPDAPHWVEAGVLAGATNTVSIPGRKNMERNVATYARWNEYGTTTIPDRHFLQRTFDEKSEEWAETAALALRAHIRNAKTEGGKVLELALNAAGRKMQTAIVRTIESAGEWATPNAPAYARWKAKYRDDDQGEPLTLTATLAKSIQYQLTTDSGALVGEPSPMSKSKRNTPGGGKKGKKKGKAKGGTK